LSVSSDIREQTKERNLSLAALFCAIALAFVGQYFSDKEKAEASSRWSSTLGRIEESHVRTFRIARVYSFNPEITYSYMCRGKCFKSSEISFPSPQFSNVSDADGFIAKYPSRKRVTVFYDPKEPSHSCLVAGETNSLNKYFWIIVVSIGASIFSFFKAPDFFKGRRAYGSDAIVMIEPPSRKDHL
jgi:hypothetical protein